MQQAVPHPRHQAGQGRRDQPGEGDAQQQGAGPAQEGGGPQQPRDQRQRTGVQGCVQQAGQRIAATHAHAGGGGKKLQHAAEHRIADHAQREHVHQGDRRRRPARLQQRRTRHQQQRTGERAPDRDAAEEPRGTGRRRRLVKRQARHLRSTP